MGTQAYFNVARKGPPGGDGTYNDIATRYDLYYYDYPLYVLIYETFPCSNDIIDRCDSQVDVLKISSKFNSILLILLIPHSVQNNIYGDIPMNCNGGDGGGPVDQGSKCLSLYILQFDVNISNNCVYID